MAGSSYYIWSAATRETGRYSGRETQGAGRLASGLIPDPPEPAAMLGGTIFPPEASVSSLRKRAQQRLPRGDLRRKDLWQAV